MTTIPIQKIRYGQVEAFNSQVPQVLNCRTAVNSIACIVMWPSK